MPSGTGSESAEYSSDDTQMDFVEQNTRENIASDSSALLLSKDKSIQYSLVPPDFSQRPTVSSFFVLLEVKLI